MRAIVLGMAALIALSAAAEAKPRKQAKWKSGASVERNTVEHGTRRSARRGITRREYDQLPIRITKSDNMRHYVYQNYPAWAAEAMQPKWWTN